jgi:hypothetical protein
MPTFESLLDHPSSLHWCLTPNGLRLDGQWRPGTESGCENCRETARQVNLRPKPKPKRRKQISSTSGVSI